MKNEKPFHEKENDTSLKKTLVVGNSFSKLVGFSKEVIDLVDHVLTYQNNIEAEKIQLMKKIQYFKRLANSDRGALTIKARKNLGWFKKQLKDLLATEFVKWLKDDEFPTGHLNIVQDVLKEICPDYEIKDLRVVPEKKYDFYLCKEFPEPRYYQIEMHEAALKAGRGVFNSCVGSGKSLVFMRLIYALGVNSLIVVPSKALLTQWQEELEKYFGTRNVQIVGSEKLSKSKSRKVKKKPIRLTNIQALAALNKKGELNQIIEDVDAFFYDEFHHAASKSTTDLLRHLDRVYFRFGASGTFLRPDGSTLSMWGVLSNVLYKYPAFKAIEEGFLTPIEVIEHVLEGIPRKNYQKEYTENYCGGEEILEKIEKILNTYVKKGEQVLILVNQKEKAGEVIHKFLNERGFDNTYISGDDEKEVVNQALADFNAKKIDILLGSKVIGEGIDVRSADHLIMAQGQKSEIAISQAVGRLVRLYPGKKIGYLHDFNFTKTKYQSKHWELRKEIYKNNFAPKKFTKA